MEDECVLLHQNPSYPFQHLPPHHPVALSQRELMAYLDRLKFFLATAPSRWSAPDVPLSSQYHPALNRFLLPSGEYVSCVLWSGLYHITGTDIVRALVFRFEAFGRPVRNMKKFEEGVFSDLRNLKPGFDACLEEPKSPFLDLLFKFQCIRTQKKQKVFYWFSVPHDRLFLDALERDLKREKMGLESTTAVVSEPALSFSYDFKRPLYEQFTAATKPSANPADSDTDSGSPQSVSQVHPTESSTKPSTSSISLPELDYSSARSSLESPKSSLEGASVHTEPPTPSGATLNPVVRSPFFDMFALFEGSPTYKQRRKKANKTRRSAGDDDGESVRCSFDGGSRHSADGSRYGVDNGRHSLDSGRPVIRSQSRTHTTFLAGPGQFAFTSAASGFPHVDKLGKQLRAQRVLPTLSAPKPAPNAYHCHLFTCPESFVDAATLQRHMRAHEDDNKNRRNQRHLHQRQADMMDIDKREVVDDAGIMPYPYDDTQCVVRGTQPLVECCSPGASPEIPHLTRVLIHPDGGHEYEYEYELEDDQQQQQAVYTTATTATVPGEWTPQSAGSSRYSSTDTSTVSLSASSSIPSPGNLQCYTHNSSSAESASSSSDAHSTPLSAASSQVYYAAEHPPYALSAPPASDRMSFNSYIPSTGVAAPTTSSTTPVSAPAAATNPTSTLPIVTPALPVPATAATTIAPTNSVQAHAQAPRPLIDLHTLRRPRSVTPYITVPLRVPHARRPSTANEVLPSTFGLGQSQSQSSSHSLQQQQRQPHSSVASSFAFGISGVGTSHRQAFGGYDASTSLSSSCSSSASSSSSSSSSASWRHHAAAQYAPRGYHPYPYTDSYVTGAAAAARASYDYEQCASAYGSVNGMECTESGQSSPENSPFAGSINTSAGSLKYGDGAESAHSSPEGSPFAVRLNSPTTATSAASASVAEYQPQPQVQPQPLAPAQQEPNPRLQAQFAHMIGLEGASTSSSPSSSISSPVVERPGLAYVQSYEKHEHDGHADAPDGEHGHAESYEEAGSSCELGGADGHGAYGGCSTTQVGSLGHPLENYNYPSSAAAAAYTCDTASLSSSSGGDTGMYHCLDEMVPAHQMLPQHYYEQAVA